MSKTDILQKAIAAEKESMKRYLEIARKTESVGGKNMLITLALDEHEHMEILEEQLQAAAEGGGFVPLRIEQSDIERLIPKLDGAFKNSGIKAVHQLSALEVAMDHEKEAAAYYRQQADRADDPDVARLFERLAEMEDAHYLMVQAEVDYIRKTGFWFDIQTLDRH